MSSWLSRSKWSAHGTCSVSAPGNISSPLRRLPHGRVEGHQEVAERARGHRARGPGQGGADQAVARVRQVLHVAGQPVPQVEDADRAVLQDPAERRRLRQPAQRTDPLVDHPLQGRAEVRGAQAHHVGHLLGPRVGAVGADGAGGPADQATHRVAHQRDRGVRRRASPPRAAASGPPGRRRSPPARARCSPAGTPGSSPPRPAARRSCAGRGPRASAWRGAARTPRSPRARAGRRPSARSRPGNAAASPARSGTTSWPSTRTARSKENGEPSSRSRSPIRPLTIAVARRPGAEASSGPPSPARPGEAQPLGAGAETRADAGVDDLGDPVVDAVPDRGPTPLEAVVEAVQAAGDRAVDVADRADHQVLGHVGGEGRGLERVRWVSSHSEQVFTERPSGSTTDAPCPWRVTGRPVRVRVLGWGCCGMGGRVRPGRSPRPRRSRWTDDRGLGGAVRRWRRRPRRPRRPRGHRCCRRAAGSSGPPRCPTRR